MPRKVNAKGKAIWRNRPQTQTEPPGKKRGRPAYAPTDKDRDMVRALRLAGYSQITVYEMLKITPHTFNKYYADDWNFAQPSADAKVAANLFRQATKDDFRSVSAATYWTRTRMGWKEAEPENKDANKFTIHVVNDPGDLNTH